MASAIPMALSGLGGIFSGIGASKPQTSTSKFDQTSTQNLDPKQTKLNKALFQQLIQLIRQGPNVSQADKDTTYGAINQNFDAAGKNLEATLAARGFGNSGKLGQGYRSLDIDRAKARQSGLATLQDQAVNRFQQWIQDAFQFDVPRSTTSSGTSTTTGSGVPWQSSVGAGLGDAASLAYLRGGLGAQSSPYLPAPASTTGSQAWWNTIGTVPSYGG